MVETATVKALIGRFSEVPRFDFVPGVAYFNLTLFAYFLIMVSNRGLLEIEFLL